MKQEIRLFLGRHANTKFTNREIANRLYYNEASVRRATRQLYEDDLTIFLDACVYPIRYYVTS